MTSYAVLAVAALVVTAWLLAPTVADHYSMPLPRPGTPQDRDRERLLEDLRALRVPPPSPETELVRRAAAHRAAARPAPAQAAPARAGRTEKPVPALTR